MNLVIMSLRPGVRDGMAMGTGVSCVGLDGAWMGTMKARGAAIPGNERDDSASDDTKPCITGGDHIRNDDNIGHWSVS
jgi:hypothetical protein